MARIRTVKPDLFRHERLFDLEKESDLPVRLAWIGLFTVCDREGRFDWRPTVLKLDIMPYDDIDFGEILDVLASADFVRKYRDPKTGKDYGFIPTFRSHQQINHREAPSVRPSPDKCEIVSINYDFGTREARVVTREARGPGGREGKGREHSIHGSATRETSGAQVLPLSPDLARPEGHAVPAKLDFEALYSNYPRKEGKKEGMKKCRSQIKTPEDLDKLKQAIANYVENLRRKKTEARYVKQFSTFMADWEQWLDPKTGTVTLNGHPKQQQPLIFDFEDEYVQNRP